MSRLSPFPGGGELPEHYKRTLDPFVALAAAAAVTSTLELATGICLVTQRDPIVTAKEVASLDRLSGGRFLFLAPPDRAEIERYAAAGASRFVFGLPPAGADEVLPRIRELAALVEPLR